MNIPSSFSNFVSKLGQPSAGLNNVIQKVTPTPAKAVTIPSNTGATNPQTSNTSKPAQNPVFSSGAAQTFIKNQVGSTPTTGNQSAYDTSNGFVTPYGLSQGQKAVQSNDPNYLNNAGNTSVNGTTGTTGSSPNTQPPTDPNQSFIDAYTKYTNALTNNSEVSNAQNAYNDYTANQNKSVAGLEGQGRGIPLTLIRGQQARLLSQTNPEATRLQNAIGIAQGNQTNAVNAAKAGIDLQTSLADRTKPIEVGGVLYQKQGDGTYKALTSTEKTAEGFTLGEGQARYDSQGKLIASGGIKDDSNEILTPTEATSLGVPYGTTKGEAYGKIPQKPATEAQSKAGLFAQRTDDANKILNNLESSISNMSGAGFALDTTLENTTLGNTVVSDTIKQVKQAERNFLNSILRRESGAVISPTEFAEGAKQYFPRPGDDAQTLKQKARNRDVAINALKNEAGNAYTSANNSLGGNITPDEESYLKDKGYTPQQIEEYKNSLTSVGNTTASTKKSNIPQKNNNPGNIKAGGLADKLATGIDKQGHLIFPDSQKGFEAMKLDVQAKINGQSRYLPPNPTLAQLGKVYAEDPKWSSSVSKILGVPLGTLTKNIPLEKLVQAIALQEGFYA